MNRRPPRRARTGSGAPTLVLPREPWSLRGACTVPSSAPLSDAVAMWEAFDEPTTSPERLAMVRGICAVCPVLAECRQLGEGEEFGFFGGLTPEERSARAVGDLRRYEVLAAEQRSRRRDREGQVRPRSIWDGPRADVLAAVEEA